MQDVVKIHSRGTIQMLLPEYCCLRVAVACAMFGEIKRKFLSLSALRDNLSRYDTRVGVYSPDKSGSKARSLVDIRAMISYWDTDGDPLNVHSNDADLNLNSSNRNANSNYGVGASLGTSLENKIGLFCLSGRVYFVLEFLIHPPSILPISSR